MKTVFPIQTATACVLKWAWSTIYLGQGTSSSCHRTDQAPIDPDRRRGTDWRPLFPWLDRDWS
jgi:hypothetical protein